MCAPDIHSLSRMVFYYFAIKDRSKGHKIIEKPSGWEDQGFYMLNSIILCRAVKEIVPHHRARLYTRWNSSLYIRSLTLSSKIDTRVQHYALGLAYPVNLGGESVWANGRSGMKVVNFSFIRSDCKIVSLRVAHNERIESLPPTRSTASIWIEANIYGFLWFQF